MKRSIILMGVLWAIVACSPTTEVPTVNEPVEDTVSANSEGQIPSLPRVDAEPVVETAVAQLQETIAPATPRPEPTDAPTVVETDATSDESVAEDETTAEEESVPDEVAAPEAESLVVSGRTQEGAFFLGNPEAPVTMIDYSDFL